REPQVEERRKSHRAASSHVKYEMTDLDKSPDLAQRYNITNYGTIRVAYGEQSTLVTKGDEEAVTHAIAKVLHSTKQRVCFIEGHGEPEAANQDEPKAYGNFRAALESENYETKSVLLATQEKVPDDCSILIVAAGAKPYLEPEIKLLKDFVNGGGRTVFLLAA